MRKDWKEKSNKKNQVDKIIQKRRKGTKSKTNKKLKTGEKRKWRGGTKKVVKEEWRIKQEEDKWKRINKELRENEIK